VSGIYQYPISLSAMTVTAAIKSTPETQMCSWGLLSSRQWFARLANADIEYLPSRIIENISDSLQYSSLYWSNHLCSTPDNNDRRLWESLKEFFERPCPLFWVEVLSIMGMVPIGAPSIGGD